MTRFASACFVCVFMLLATSASAQDEPWLLTGELRGVLAVTAPQSDTFGPGAAATVGLYRPLASFALVGLRLSGGFLSDGPPPPRMGVLDPGVGGLATFGAAIRLRWPGDGSDPRRATGLFLEGVAGGALTGSEVRPSIEVGLGWGFPIGPITLAPTARYQQIIEFDDQLDNNDARLVMVGIEVTLFDAEPASDDGDVDDGGLSDRDHDGIFDPDDGCPDEPEDRDGFEDEDGCPDDDNDRDGILDRDDACPMQPEDRDGFEDEDGCPDPDNDGDRILDVDDACPNEAEVVNGVDDQDGCPDEGLITMIDERIVLEERVLFDFERARVKHAARPILAAIVTLFQQQGDWERVRVEGHADIRGSEEFNAQLSRMRADRVRQVLVSLGMPADMIVAEGYGATHPRVDAQDEAGHQLNRRVEFVVVARRQADGAPAAETPEVTP